MARHTDPLSDARPLLRRVYAFISYRIGPGPDAEDVLSEVVERALRYRDGYDPERGTPLAWLTGIARRVIADRAGARLATATELPEVLNAVIWARQGKTQLAMANISGAMMVQATVPAGIGLLFTPWHFDNVLVSASLATLGAVTYLRLLAVSDRLRPGWVTGTAAFYGAFAVALAVELR